MMPVRAMVGLVVAVLGGLTLLLSVGKPPDWTPRAYRLSDLPLRRDRVRIISLILLAVGIALAVYSLR
jgi:hypothetical protein